MSETPDACNSDLRVTFFENWLCSAIDMYALRTLIGPKGSTSLRSRFTTSHPERLVGVGQFSVRWKR